MNRLLESNTLNTTHKHAYGTEYSGLEGTNKSTTGFIRVDILMTSSAKPDIFWRHTESDEALSLIFVFSLLISSCSQDTLYRPGRGS